MLRPGSSDPPTVIYNCPISCKLRVGAETQQNRGVEEGQKWNNLVIFPAEESWVRRDKMSTSRIGRQHWKITEKLEKLLMLVRRFGKNTAHSSSA